MHRILLVDDEPDIRAIAKLSLEAVGGYLIEPCGSGEEAIEKVEEFSPELILMDVMMPGKDGPATLSELRQIKQMNNIPIVFMTARVQKREVQEYMDVGAAGVIAKPFDPMSLPQQVGEIWNKLKSN